MLGVPEERVIILGDDAADMEHLSEVLVDTIAAVPADARRPMTAIPRRGQRRVDVNRMQPVMDGSVGVAARRTAPRQRLWACCLFFWALPVF